MTVFTRSDGSEEKKPVEEVVKVEEGLKVEEDVRGKKRSSSFGSLSNVRLTPSPPCRTPSPPRYTPKRYRYLTQLLVLVVILMMCFSFVAGYFYKQYFNQRKYEGWCGVMLNDKGTERMDEKVEVNEQELYERIQVPKFGRNRPAIFVHDFRENLTAIVDILGRRCFLKELNKESVSPPGLWLDVIGKKKTNLLAPSKSVKETFRVGGMIGREELEQINSFIINRHCIMRPVYRLVKTEQRRRTRRDALERLDFTAVSGETREEDTVLI